MENEQVRVPRFGIFAKVVQKPKTMTNIQTKEKYQVPAKYRVSFKVSSILRKKASDLEVP
jgi:nucleoid DNA-binding protein